MGLSFEGPAYIFCGQWHSIAPYDVVAQLEPELEVVVGPVVLPDDLGLEGRWMLCEIRLFLEEMQKEEVDYVLTESTVCSGQLIDTGGVDSGADDDGVVGPGSAGPSRGASRTTRQGRQREAREYECDEGCC